MRELFDRFDTDNDGRADRRRSRPRLAPVRASSGRGGRLQRRAACPLRIRRHQIRPPAFGRFMLQPSDESAAVEFAIIDA